MNTSKKLKRVIILSGGTVVHIRPHLAICAPAYGTIGNDISNEFITTNTTGLQILPVFTKMAGGNTIETNDDLSAAIDVYLGDEDVACIILAVAVCDFVPIGITINPLDPLDINIGKKHPRLDSSVYCAIDLAPAEKIVNKIKQIRPDIMLVSFKTTSAESESVLELKCESSINRNQSDVVFENDIRNRTNSLTFKTRMLTTNYDDRRSAVVALVSCIKQELTSDLI